MNQNPEQLARDEIDRQLVACGWVIQDKKTVNLSAALGVAVREYQTKAGPADYVFFVDRKPVGLIEAKRSDFLEVVYKCLENYRAEIENLGWELEKL